MPEFHGIPPRCWLNCTLRTVLAAMAFAVAGCSEPEPIREYTVARPPTPGAVWFFKLIGPDDAVTAATESLRNFVASVRFDERSGLPQWTLPEGWAEEAGGNSVRYKTLKLPGESSLEVAITQISAKIPLSQDDLRLQSNMLREQVGVPTVAAGDAPSAVDSAAESPLTVGDYVGTFYNFAGETTRFGQTRLVAVLIAVPVAPRPAMQPSGVEFPLAFTAPPEWKAGKATQFSLVSMSVGEGESTATITITQAAGPAAGQRQPLARTGGD